MSSEKDRAPLDGLDEQEAEWLVRYAEREGLSLEEARRRRDRAGQLVLKGFEPHSEQLEELAEAERHIVPLVQSSGIPVTGLGTALMAAAAGHASITGGSEGGKTPKRRKWAERAAERVTSWEELPTGAAPWEFEDLLVRVYRDGDKLCAADIDDMDAEPKTLAKDSFKKRYLNK